MIKDIFQREEIPVSRFKSYLVLVIISNYVTKRRS